MRTLQVRAYVDQLERWPSDGRVILAQYDDSAVVVYQAFSAKVAKYAVEKQRFGGGFSMDRMSWIKTNFMWMMNRSEWGTAEGQEHVLAIWMKRDVFNAILEKAVHSTFEREVYETEEAWKKASAESDVRIQWDPDHSPKGGKLNRRAIQLGLRGDTLRSYAHDGTVEIQDISEIVRELAKYKTQPEMLLSPVEKPYPVTDAAVAKRLGVEVAK